MNVMANRGKSAVQVALATIKGVSGSKPHWIVVAKLTEDIRRSGNWQPEYSSPTDWLEAVAEASGYSPNTIRRFIAAFKYLEERGPRTRAYVADPFCGGGRGLAFAPVELIKRINDLSPKQADATFTQLEAGKLSFRDIKHRYDKLFAGKVDVIVGNPPYEQPTETPRSSDVAKLGTRHGHHEKQSLAQVVQSEVDVLSGSNSARVFSDHYVFEFVAPDVVAVGQEDFSVTFVDAFDHLKLSSKAPPSTIRKAIGDIAFNSSFFRRYWVILDTSSDAADLLIAAFSKLDLKSVGIAKTDLADHAHFEIVLEPSAPPSPDRHDLARSAILSQGIPN